MFEVSKQNFRTEEFLQLENINFSQQSPTNKPDKNDTHTNTITQYESSVHQIHHYIQQATVNDLTAFSKNASTIQKKCHSNQYIPQGISSSQYLGQQQQQQQTPVNKTVRHSLSNNLIKKVNSDQNCLDHHLNNSMSEEEEEFKEINKHFKSSINYQQYCTNQSNMDIKQEDQNQNYKDNIGLDDDYEQFSNWNMSNCRTVQEELQRHLKSYDITKDGWYKNQQFSLIDKNQQRCKLIVKLYFQPSSKVPKVSTQQNLDQIKQDDQQQTFKIIELNLVKCIYNRTPSIIFIAKNITSYHKIKNLIEINENKSKILSHVSHEIRTPLNCIIGMLEEAQKENQLSSFINPALASAQLLLNLSNDLLDQAQQNSGTFQLVIEKFNLKQLICTIKEFMKVLCQSKNIDLIVHYGDDVPEIVTSDYYRIRQIIINLIGNAVKFTQEGSIKVQVSLNTKNVKNIIKIEVQDTGIGISEENQKKLFNAFGKLSNNQLNPQGVGLGLLISNKLAILLSQMNKGLSVVSKENEGTTFFFLIKDIEQEEQSSQFTHIQTIEMKSQNAPNGTKKSIRQKDSNSSDFTNSNLRSSMMQKKMTKEDLGLGFNPFNNQNNFFFKLNTNGSQHLPLQQPLIKQNNNNNNSHRSSEGPSTIMNNLQNIDEVRMHNLEHSQSERFQDNQVNVEISPRLDSNPLTNTFYVKLSDLGIRLQNEDEVQTNQNQNSQAIIRGPSISLTNSNSQQQQNTTRQETQTEIKRSVCSCVKVLIVDDEPFNILTLKNILKREENLECDSAHNGKMAIQLIEKKALDSCCKIYKIIFMDINMPIMNGFETTKKIRKFLMSESYFSNNCVCNIIGLSGYSEEKSREEAILSGMNEQFAKPIKRDVLKQIIQTYYYNYN